MCSLSPSPRTKCLERRDGPRARAGFEKSFKVSIEQASVSQIVLKYFFQIQIIAIWYIKYCFISSSKLETWEFYLKAKLFGGIVSVRIPGGLPFLLSGV